MTEAPRWKRLGWLAGGALTAGLIAMATVPQLSWWTLERLRTLSAGAWGWPLKSFLPHELLGFGTGFTQSFSALGWIASGIILGAVTYVCFRQRTAEKFAAPGFWLIAGILLSYAVMTWHFGSGHYNAWKWIAYFQPLLCAVIYSVLALGVKAWISSRGPGTARQSSYTRVVGAVGVAVAVLALLNTHRMFTHQEAGIRLSKDGTPIFRTVPQSIEEFPTVAAEAGIREVNIDLPADWETVWAWYGLRQLRTYPLNPSWLSQKMQPQAPWDLQRVDAGQPPADQRVVPIDGSYRFVEHRTDPPSDAADGLDADLTLFSQRATRTDRVLHLHLKNTGTRCWLPAEKRKKVHGGVLLRASSIADDGSVVEQWLRRRPVSTASCLGSGWSLTLTLKVPRNEERGLRLQLVADDVGPFGEVLDVKPLPSAGGSGPR